MLGPWQLCWHHQHEPQSLPSWCESLRVCRWRRLFQRMANALHPLGRSQRLLSNRATLWQPVQEQCNTVWNKVIFSFQSANLVQKKCNSSVYTLELHFFGIKCSKYSGKTRSIPWPYCQIINSIGFGYTRLDISLNFYLPSAQDFSYFETVYIEFRRKLLKSTCPNDSFTCPRLSGSGICLALLCRIHGSLSFMRKVFNNLCHFSVERWWKI